MSRLWCSEAPEGSAFAVDRNERTKASCFFAQADAQKSGFVVLASALLVLHVFLMSAVAQVQITVVATNTIAVINFPDRWQPGHVIDGPAMRAGLIAIKGDEVISVAQAPGDVTLFDAKRRGL